MLPGTKVFLRGEVVLKYRLSTKIIFYECYNEACYTFFKLLLKLLNIVLC